MEEVGEVEEKVEGSDGSVSRPRPHLCPPEQPPVLSLSRAWRLQRMFHPPVCLRRSDCVFSGESG